MIKLNRTTEYGLLALSYIQQKGQTASAREIAEHFDLPFEILAKTLQRLKDQGIIGSSFGTRGGYALTRDLKTLNLADFLKMLEGPMGVVNCVHETSCEYSSCCTIKNPMQALNARIADFLSRISVDELTRSQPTVGRLGSIDQSTVALARPLYGEEP